MKVSDLVAHLRRWCPSFGPRVAGGIEWDAVSSSVRLDGLQAHVILGDDRAEGSAENVVVQDLDETFEVCVVIPNPPGDERGVTAGDLVNALRAELCRALVGWSPAEHYDPIQYQGRELLVINRARTVYRFTFVTGCRIGRNAADQPPETWQELEVDGLPELEGIDFNVDFIDPMVDPNLAAAGPDGRIELTLREDL